MHMNRNVIVALGAILSVGLIVLGLWGWERAEAVVLMMGWEKRTIGAWSARCGAAALIAAAEAVLLALIVERVYRSDRVCRTARLSALLIFMVCTVSAIALGLAGR
jgi:quinol-cytochrome oxidoreductase complex cytochrome b subunit